MTVDIPSQEVSEDVLDILRQSRIEDSILYFPDIRLERSLYTEVNNVLVALGGKWNRKVKGHIFSSDPSTAIRAVISSQRIILPEDVGYYPTPEPLARQVVMMANIEPRNRVLEPSAGQGHLVRCIERCDPSLIVLYDILPENVIILRERFPYIVYESDFLEEVPVEQFDRVVMNPPFENKQDIDHVLHAWKFLVPGGRLVAIMNYGTVFRDDAKTVSFREFVHSYSGEMLENPEGSFKADGTNVRTVTLVIDKPLKKRRRQR